MSDRIRLQICPACQTGVPMDARRCPECGAPLPSANGPSPAAGGPGAEEMADLLGALFGAAGPSRREALSPFVRGFLGRYLGCLTTVLVLVFGLPLLVGALAGNVLGALAWVLLAVGVAGLALTAWLIRLVR